jgi:hypothetical protein
MPAGLELRDIQAATTMAWHKQTRICQYVTRRESMPWEVIEAEVQLLTPEGDQIRDTGWRQLVADDDKLPVGDPYREATYFPSSVEGFWNTISEGMGDTPYQVISAGSVNNRGKIFASIKVSEGFKIGEREFLDYITIVDSFDKSTALQARYSNVCVVCQNTFAAVLGSGREIGKAKHTANFTANVERLVKAIDLFAGTSATFKALLEEAQDTPCTREEARHWLTGVEAGGQGREDKRILQKTARMVELFETGRGNRGSSRLDALSAYTDFHSHESSKSTSDTGQYMNSEWGTSSLRKTEAVVNLRDKWDTNVTKGRNLLALLA